MKIGIDARLIEETGVGRYIRNLISNVSVIDDHNDYVVFLPEKVFDAWVPPNSRWKKVLAGVHWHTLAEQFVMPRIFAAEDLDLVHIPYHNPPILYRGNMVITIHDLTILHFSTGKATTLPIPLYWLKRLGYWLELWIGLRKAAKIIAVSTTTKQEIMDHFHIPSNRIAVTYEGVNLQLLHNTKNKKALMVGPYVLYVGNAYPHKNIELLIQSFAHALRDGTNDDSATLVLVGKEDYFYRRMKRIVHDMGLEKSVIFFGYANDTELANLYANAQVFVFPSLMEGFGLPALEALSFGCPVVASDIPIFHEILGNNALYFDPNDSTSLSKILRVYMHKPDSRREKTSYSFTQFS